jgi:putative membrane protein
MLAAGTVFASPGALLVVVAAGTAYALGRERWHRAAGRGIVSTATATAFFAGLVTVGVALASPLDRAADTSLPAHMVQHVLLLAVAGPLLAFGLPIPTLFWSLPDRHRRRVLGWTRRIVRAHDRRFALWVTVALAAEAVVMWSWHLPVAYDAAVRIPAVHALEHASFLLVSVTAWWSVTSIRRSLRGAAAIAALFGSLPGMALGVAMVLAPHAWYPVYAGPGALADQQLAGVIMWGFGGMAAVIEGVVLFASWLADDVSAPSDRIPAAVSRAGAAR